MVLIGITFFLLELKMKFKIKVKEKDNPEKNPWLEPYNKPEIRSKKMARTWAKSIVDFFNNTLREGEKERVLLDVIFDLETK